MSIVSCAACTQPVPQQNKHQRFCSDACRYQSKDRERFTACAWCSKSMGYSGKHVAGKSMHQACRVESTPHGVSKYRKGCRCAECRDAVRLNMLSYSAKVKARDGVSPTQKARPKQATGQVCVVCSKELKRVALTGSPTHKECRVKRTPGLLHKRFQAKIDKAARGTTGGKRVFVSGGCAWCAETFTAAAGVYCSDKCKVAASFKRRSGGKSFTVSPRVRAAIYERDSWTCQLCAHPVDGTLSHRDNWSASLDHIIPQSHMLIPDHSPSNLRLVHKMCNSLRGDGSNMTEAEFHRRVNLYFEGAAA